MILVPCFAKSYGFNFEKNANEFQSTLNKVVPAYAYATLADRLQIFTRDTPSSAKKEALKNLTLGRHTKHLQFTLTNLAF